MFTIPIMFNFKGTKQETIKATLICMALDASYIIPSLIITQ